jgi:hypothetical protein
MKTLPGLKLALFFSLVFSVGLAVYAGPKGTQLWNKRHKLLIAFGWSETTPNEFNPVPHSISDIKSYLTGTNKPVKYKLQHYSDGNPDGAPEGDLNACLPAPTGSSTAAPAPNSSLPQAGPTGTPSGAKTQSIGLVQFDDPAVANDFIDWVNSAAAVPANASPKPKGNHK